MAVIMVPCIEILENVAPKSAIYKCQGILFATIIAIFGPRYLESQNSEILKIRL